MADQAAARLAEQFTLVGSAASLVMDAAAVESHDQCTAAAPFDLLVLFQASFADSSMAVQLAECAAAQHAPVLLWSVPDERDGGRLRLNSLCGINLAGHALMLRQHRLRLCPLPGGRSSRHRPGGGDGWPGVGRAPGACSTAPPSAGGRAAPAASRPATTRRRPGRDLRPRQCSPLRWRRRCTRPPTPTPRLRASPSWTQ
jgi:hypothetical protein